MLLCSRAYAIDMVADRYSADKISVTLKQLSSSVGEILDVAHAQKVRFLPDYQLMKLFVSCKNCVVGTLGSIANISKCLNRTCVAVSLVHHCHG